MRGHLPLTYRDGLLIREADGAVLATFITGALTKLERDLLGELIVEAVNERATTLEDNDALRKRVLELEKALRFKRR